MALLEVNTEETEKKIQVFSKYPYQIITIVMAFCVAYLFVGQRQLEIEFRDYLKSDQRTLTPIIVENTEVLKELKTIIIKNK